MKLCFSFIYHCYFILIWFYKPCWSYFNNSRLEWRNLTSNHLIFSPLGSSQIFKFADHTEPVRLAGNGDKTKQFLDSSKQVHLDARNISLGQISDISGDVFGNVYISSCEANQIFLLKKDFSLSLLAGDFLGSAGITPDDEIGKGNKLNCPWGLFANYYVEGVFLYFVERFSCSVRVILPNGRLRTLAGELSCGSLLPFSFPTSTILNYDCYLVFSETLEGSNLTKKIMLINPGFNEYKNFELNESKIRMVCFLEGRPSCLVETVCP